MRQLVQFGLLGIACVGPVFGCNRSGSDSAERRSETTYDNRDQSGAGERVGTTTVTGADVGSLANRVAIERIVTARCARETACNNVGADKRFTNYDLCSSELRSSISKDLAPSECPRGIDEAVLDTCMDAIRSESCNNPIETIQRLATCRTSEMCMKLDSRAR